jgi:hypothetical protein
MNDPKLLYIFLRACVENGRFYGVEIMGMRNDGSLSWHGWQQDYDHKSTCVRLVRQTARNVAEAHGVELRDKIVYPQEEKKA